MPGAIDKIRAFFKKPKYSAEIAVDALCLAVSYGLLFILPQKTDLLFWGLFGLSAFLFCIGFFRIWALIDVPDQKKGAVTAARLLAVPGVVLNTVGIFAIFASHGRNWSIAVATLLFIEALVMFSISAETFRTQRSKWIISAIFRAAAVLMFIAAIAYAVVTDVSDTAIYTGGFMLIEGVVLWATGRANDPFFSSSSPVPGMKMSAQEICEAFSDTDTQLGRPWLGKVRSVGEDTIIYGPSEEGVFVYGCRHMGRFFFVSSTESSDLDPAEAEAHKTAEIPGSKGICLGQEDLPEAYANMMTRYIESGNKVWSIKLKKKKRSGKKR